MLWRATLYWSRRVRYNFSLSFFSFFGFGARAGPLQLSMETVDKLQFVVYGARSCCCGYPRVALYRHAFLHHCSCTAWNDVYSFCRLADFIFVLLMLDEWSNFVGEILHIFPRCNNKIWMLPGLLLYNYNDSEQVEGLNINLESFGAVENCYYICNIGIFKAWFMYGWTWGTCEKDKQIYFLINF